MTEFLSLIDEKNEDTELLFILSRIAQSRIMRYKSDISTEQHTPEMQKRYSEMVVEALEEITDNEVKIAMQQELRRIEQIFIETGAAHALEAIMAIREKANSYIADGREAPDRIKPYLITAEDRSQLFNS